MIVDLKKIQISAFQSIALDQELEFEKGVYGILGINRDSGGGSNGAGKTSLARALTAAVLGPSYTGLSIKDIKNIHLDDHAPKVLVVFVVDGKELKIERVLGHSLKAWFDGEPIVGRSQDIQEKILQLLGLTADQWVFLTHKKQDTTNNFLYLKDAHKKEFLLHFFKGDTFDACQLEIKNQLKTLAQQQQDIEKEANGYNVLIQQLNKQVDALQERAKNFDWSVVDSLKNKQKELQQRIIDFTEELQRIEEDPLSIQALQDVYNQYIVQRQSLEAVQQECSAERQKLEQALLDIKKQQAQAIAEHQSTINILEAQIIQWQKQIKSLEIEQRTVLQDRATLNTLYQKLTSDIESIQSQINALLNGFAENCSHCGQPLPLNKRQVLVDSLQKKIDQHNAELVEIQNKINSLPNKDWEGLQKLLQDNILSKQEELIKLRHKIAEMGQEEREKQIKTQLMLLQQKQVNSEQAAAHAYKIFQERKANFIAQVQANLKASQKELTLTSDLIKSKEQEYFRIQKELETASQERNRLEKLNNQLHEQLLNLKKELNIFHIMEEVFHKNGLLSYVFDDLLDALTALSNDYLRQIPLTERFTIDFTAAKAKANGAIELKDRVISYTLKNELGEEISIESLSGAERQILALLVDIALDTLLSSRLGVQINYKIYDEQLSYLDSHYKIAMLQFLERQFHAATLLIVDHGSELHSALNRHIIIEKQGGISYLKTG